MLFWLLALVVTAIACAALYYAGAGRRVNAPAAEEPAELAHLKLQLKEIETDAALGRLSGPEAVAAKGELAREVLGDIPISVSHEVSPLAKEYARASTTALDRVAGALPDCPAATQEGAMHRRGGSLVS